MDFTEYNKHYDAIKAEYADYMPLLEHEANMRNVCGPHCDSFVLHSPDKGCEYCNNFPVLQDARIKLKIAFTDKYPEMDERPCPATRLRTVDSIDRWPGNRARTADAPISDIPF
jgi:hypothetical protein